MADFIPAELAYPVTSLLKIAGMLVAMIGIGKLGDEAFPANPRLANLRTYFRNSMGVRTFARAYVGSLFAMDVLYGRRFLSWRALGTSVLMSCLWLAVIIGVTVLEQGRRAWVYNAVFASTVVHHFWGFVAVGLLVDYLTGWTCRWLLHQLPGRGVATIAASLMVAALAATLLFYACYSLAKTAFLGQARLALPWQQVSDWIQFPSNLVLALKLLADWHLSPIGGGQFDIRDGTSEVVYAFPEGLLFLSSQFALLWLVLHTCAHWLYFGGYAVSRWARRLVGAAAFEARPLQSSATVTALLVALPMWGVALAWHYAGTLRALATG